MKIADLMKREVAACVAADSLREAARLMWENDCGCIPVVDADRRVTGMLTDRDICMAAQFSSGSLGSLAVSTAMSKTVLACAPDEAPAAAIETMRRHQVRRLPVVDGGGRLVGILSLNDLAREAARTRGKKKRDVTPTQIADTLAEIGEPGPAGTD